MLLPKTLLMPIQIREFTPTWHTSNPDVDMDVLLEQTSTSQIFTVFGRPRTDFEKKRNGEYIVKMEGVDIYNPWTIL